MYVLYLAHFNVYYGFSELAELRDHEMIIAEDVTTAQENVRARCTNVLL